ncbi:hypothetical protein GCM10018987_19640 [Streptomyces cremeus]
MLCGGVIARSRPLIRSSVGGVFRFQVLKLWPPPSRRMDEMRADPFAFLMNFRVSLGFLSPFWKLVTRRGERPAGTCPGLRNKSARFLGFLSPWKRSPALRFSAALQYGDRPALAANRPGWWVPGFSAQ